MDSFIEFVVDQWIEILFTEKKKKDRNFVS